MCFLIDPHRSPSVATPWIKLALSNSGQRKSNLSTVHWTDVIHPLPDSVSTPTPAKKSSAAAFQAASSVEKMAVLVRIGLLFPSFYTYRRIAHVMYLYIDIGDFLKQEIKGPATFSCKSGACRFEEPAMNTLIDQIFADQYITLTCNGGECLHYSQVPGYVVRYLC